MFNRGKGGTSRLGEGLGGNSDTECGVLQRRDALDHEPCQYSRRDHEDLLHHEEDQ
jgi:hypothetical protein